MEIPDGAETLRAANAAATALRGAVSPPTGAAHRRPDARPPLGIEFVARWHAILAGAIARAVERVKVRRRRALDRRLVASFDDYKLRDIGIDSRALIDSTTERS